MQKIIGNSKYAITLGKLIVDKKTETDVCLVIKQKEDTLTVVGLTSDRLIKDVNRNEYILFLDDIVLSNDIIEVYNPFSVLEQAKIVQSIISQYKNQEIGKMDSYRLLSEKLMIGTTDAKKIMDLYL